MIPIQIKNDHKDIIGVCSHCGSSFKGSREENPLLRCIKSTHERGFMSSTVYYARAWVDCPNCGQDRGVKWEK